MTVTFYVGDYTRKTGKRVKGEGEQFSTDKVDRIRIEAAPGEILDRPASKKDIEKYAEAYAAFKKPKAEPKAGPPEQPPAPAHKPRFFGKK